jgi:glycosyltransferase involved in cell wall biosynthesis
MSAEASLKILQLCTKYPYPPVDGGAIAMFNMVRGFHKAGHKVTVLGMSTLKHPVQLKDFPDDVRRMAAYHAVEIDTQVKFREAFASFVFSRKESYHVRRFTSESFNEELIYVLKNGEFDIVQLETLYMVEYIPTIRSLAPQALIALRMHNVEHEIWERRAANEKQPIKNFVFTETARRIKEYERKVMAAGEFDVLVPITARDGGRFKSMGNQKPDHYCLSGMDLDTLIKGRPRLGEPSVFFLGSLDWEPNREGLRWFLKYVWPRVHSTYPEVKFHIAGRNMPKSIARLKRKNIVIEGEVPDAAQFMRSKSIMVAPLFSGSGMRVKLIEGMANGKAIVATKIAKEGLNDVKHGYHMLLSDDPVEFATYVSALIEDPNLLSTISTHAFSLVQKRYSNDFFVGKLLQFYREQLKKKREE